jgi:O-antigen/teichoic acid export membrane protein
VQEELTREGGIRGPLSSTVRARTIGLDIAVQLIGRFANLAIGIVVTALLARTLGGAGFGVWSTLVAIATLVGVVGDLGLEQVALRSAAADPEHEPSWLGALVFLKQLLSLAAMGLCMGAVVLIAPNHQALVAGIVMMLTFLTTAASSLRVAFQLRIRNSLTIAMMTVQSVLWGAVVIWAHTTGAGIVALAIGFTATTSFAALGQGALALRIAAIDFTGLRRNCAELIRVGVPVAIGSALVLGYGQIDQILVFKIAGSEDAGLYGAAYRLLTQSSFVPVSVTTTVFALLAASFTSDTQRFRVLLQTSLELVLAAAIGALAFTIFYSSEIVSLLFGQAFARASSALPVLMGAFVLVSIGYLQDLLVIISRRQKLFVAIAVVALALNVGLNVALIPRYGFMAAAWVTVATELFVVVARWFAVRSRLPAAPSLGRIPRLLVAGAAVSILLLGARALGLPMLAALALTLLVYSSLLFVTGAISKADVRLMLRKNESV